MHLSTAGWISLICLIVLIAAINIPLFLVIYQRRQLRLPFIHSGTLTSLVKTARQPWRAEDDQLDELSSRVQTLHKPEQK